MSSAGRTWPAGWSLRTPGKRRRNSGPLGPLSRLQWERDGPQSPPRWQRDRKVSVSVLGHLEGTVIKTSGLPLTVPPAGIQGTRGDFPPHGLPGAEVPSGWAVLPAPGTLASPPQCWAAPHNQFFWNIKNLRDLRKPNSQEAAGSRMVVTRGWQMGRRGNAG